MNSIKVFEQIFIQIDHFFSAERKSDHIRKPGTQEAGTKPVQPCLEWDLNQGYTDIASRDLTIIFNRITPHIFRKLIVMINQFLLFYLLTDQEVEYQYQIPDNKKNPIQDPNQDFTLHHKSITSKTVNKESFSRFSRVLEGRIKGFYYLIKNIFSVTILQGARTHPFSSKPIIISTLKRIFASHDPPKLISAQSFHKRN